MPRYRLNHDYASGELGPWKKGSEIEVTEDEAAWVEQDSPGALSPVREKKAEPPVAKKAAPKADTAHSTGDASGLTKG